MIGAIKEFFVPQNKIFFDHFEKIASTTLGMSDMLSQMLAEQQEEKRRELLAKIHESEHDNDYATHTIFITLGKYFITPFDREDIHYLAKALDDISDYIYASAKKMVVYKIDPVNDTGIKQLADLIHICVQNIEKAVIKLRAMENIAAIQEAVLAINTAENEADRLYEILLNNLFETCSDLKEIIRRKDIYQSLEIATDKCEDASNTIEAIVVKYT